MSLILQRDLNTSATPVHILVVVVGSYLSPSKDLAGAGAFAQEIVNFWRDDDRLFPAGQALATIDVLASEPGGAVRVTGDQTMPVDRPTYDNVKAALRRWAQTIAMTAGSVGILHWIGHGMEHVIAGGGIIGLSCDGPKVVGSNEQAAIGWTRAINAIDQLTVGHPIYCFIDACRTRDTTEREYLGLDIEPDWAFDHNAHVFTSTSRLERAFWITAPKPATTRSGCDAGALATRAFLAGLSGFGARYSNEANMPVQTDGLLEAAKALVGRWAGHQGLDCGSPQSRPGGSMDPILYTAKPMSSVDVTKSADPPHGCEALTPSVVEQSETNQAPYEFRLSRKPHKFRFDGENWSPEKLLIHPHMTLNEQEFV
jgi:hypothetical protein